MNIHRLNTKWEEKYHKLFKEDYDKHIKSITFIVTETCNLACTYCYEVNKSKRCMSKEVAEKAVDFILSDTSYVDTGDIAGVILEFTGGEPLLQIELIDHIIGYFNNKTLELNHKWFNKYMISISSNGLLYETPKVQEFINKYRDRLSIGISIDGNKQLHDACRVDLAGNGSYDRVYSAVQKMLTQYKNAKTKVTFSHENLPYLSDAIVHLFDIGIQNVNANVVFENVWEPTDHKIFYKELIKLADIIIDNDYFIDNATSLFSENIGNPMPDFDNNNWCGGNGAMLAIGVDGELYPCVRYAPVSLPPNIKPIVLGNVFDGVTNLDSHEVCTLCSITRRSQSTDECFNCAVASGCAWCSAHNYMEFGTPNKRATYICKMHKARVYANYYYWNKLYAKLGIDKRLNLNLTEEDIDEFRE